MRRAWNSRAKSDGPERGPRTARADRDQCRWGCEGRFELLDTGGAEAATDGGDRIGIAIDAEDSRTKLAEDCRVPSAAERRIDRAPTTGRPGPDGFREDRDV